jgi:hypothetical protein
MSSITKINYFVSYVFTTSDGKSGNGNTSVTLDKPITDYHQIQEIHEFLIKKGEDKKINSVCITWYKELMRMSL